MSQFSRTDAGIWVPRDLAPAVRRVAVVFYHSKKLNRIVVGAPEEYPVPKVMQAMGFNKVVCRSAHEVEVWSQKLRDQERRDEEMTDAEREAFEGPLRAQLRADLMNRMANSRNAVNREFCRQALENMDAAEERQRTKRESMMHCEGFEAGK